MHRWQRSVRSMTRWCLQASTWKPLINPIELKHKVLTHQQQVRTIFKQKRTSGQTFSKNPIVTLERDDGFRVAVIGRPNTGKSTLFNALTGRYHAIADKVAGVTRDCQEGHGRLQLGFKVMGQFGKYVETHRPRAIECTFIDTPGADNIDRMIVQTENSIKSADLAIIVTDYRAGIQDWDIQIARYAMIKGVPAIHVANKCDQMHVEELDLESHTLPGLGTPIPVSSERKYGLGDLAYVLQPFYTRFLMRKHLKKVNAFFDGETSELRESAINLKEEQEKLEKESSKDEVDDETIRLAIIGRANVGKSTMLNQLIGTERVVVSPIPGTTRDTIEVKGVSMGRRILLADTAGIRKFKHIHQDRVQLLSAEDALRTIRYSHVVILLIDSMEPLTNEDLDIAAMIEKEGRGIVIGANKWDLVKEPFVVASEIEKKVVNSLSQIQGLSVVVCSGLKRTNLKLLMKKAIECFDKWNMRIPTSRLNDFVQKYIESKQFPASFPKIQYMTQVNTRPPTFAIFFKRGEELPRNFERQILNAIRTEFGFDGVPIRIIQKSSTVRSRELKARENRKAERKVLEKKAEHDPVLAEKLKKEEEERQKQRKEKKANKKVMTRREQRRFAKAEKKRIRTRRYRKKNK
jgi:GTP-binding protein